MSQAGPRRPVIGITTYVARARWGPWDQPAALVPLAYVEAVLAVGGLPVLLPPSAAGLTERVTLCDALILCGGPDLDPALYGAPRSDRTRHLSPERDRPELGLVAAALERDLPILGICRGMQVLNVARGGSLIQHLPDLVGHDGHATRPGAFDRHPVQIAPDSLVGRVLGPSAVVHSGHHQGIGRLGAGVTACAWAPDGTVEALQIDGAGFAVGVLWHPEQGCDRRLLAALVAAGGGARSGCRRP